MFNSKVIIACDFSNKKELYNFLKNFKNEKLFLKIGMELFYSTDFSLIKELKKLGHNIFLDLKLHDIPNTVKKALNVLKELNCEFITVHLLGGPKMLSFAKEAILGTNTKLVGVTILTSHSQEEIKLLGLKKKILKNVLNLAKIGIDNNIEYFVTSPLEANILKKLNVNVITPGIRSEQPAGDQTRVATPASMKGIADFIVVGREITESSNPLETYKKIQKEFE